MSCLKDYLESNYIQIQDLCRRKIYEHADDLCNDICLFLLTSKDKRMEEMCAKNEIWYYIIRIINISAFSKTSRYYYKYKKHKEFELRNIDSLYSLSKIEKPSVNVEKLMRIETILQELDWFDAELFRVYYMHEHSLNSLSNATGISKTTIQKSVYKTKAYIQEKTKRLR